VDELDQLDFAVERVPLVSGKARVLAVKRLIAGLACAVAACLPAHALASVHTDDVAATRAYLGADYVYERAAYAEVGASVAAIEARASEIGDECPSVLTYAPRDAAFGELGEEAEMTAFFAGKVPERPILLRMANTIERLGWSDRRLTRLVRAEATAERTFATQALPDVCADIAAWKADRYAALPRSATLFLARVQAFESLADEGPSEESTEAAILRLLRPYEGPAERQTVRRIERLEAQIGRRLKAAVADAEKKLAAAFGVVAL
jgi:hypothetical protein